MKDRSLGLIILELLVGLAVIMPALLSFTLTLHNSVHLNARVKLEHKDFYTLLRIRSLLRKITLDLDSHSFFLPPRIHTGSKIRFTDGTINKAGKNLNSPNPASAAVTGLELDFPCLHRVVKSSSKGDAIEFLACPLFKSQLKNDLYHSYIGLSADGFFELIGSFKKSKEKKPCRNFLLTPEPSMTAPFLDYGGAKFVRLILPVKNHYTLYVDQKQQLRYLSHSGAKNIENQPLVKGIKSLIIQSDYLFGGAILSLAVKAELASGKIEKFSFQNHLARQSHYNLFLSRP